MDVGYDKPLYILPFDDLSSFEKALFGWSGALAPEQTARIAATKQVIYDGFRTALRSETGDGHAGIRVDEQFGAAILRDARASGGITCEEFQPSFVTVLVRYNVEDDPAKNRRQAARLKTLSDYVHAHDRRLMFELLAPMTHEQSAFWDALVALRDGRISHEQAAQVIADRYREWIRVFVSAQKSR